MNTPLRLLLGSAFAATLLASEAPRDTVAFAPAEGTELTKTFDMESLFELDELSIIVDGQDMGGLLPAFEIAINADTSITVADVYETMADGRPLKLRRTYEDIRGNSTLEMDSDLGDEGEDVSMSSPLQGETVLFSLDEESGEYTTSFAEGEGDTDLIGALEEDMDLRFLLPQEEVKDGDSWTVDVSQFSHLVWPGGNLHWTAEGEESIEDFGDVIGDVGDGITENLDELLEGECQCKLLGTEDGVATIEVTLEIGSAIDMTEALTELMNGISEESGEELPVEFEVADLNLDVEAEGLLKWNVSLGHVESFEMSSDGLMGLDLAVSTEAMGESSSIEASLELSSSMRHRVTAE